MIKEIILKLIHVIEGDWNFFLRGAKHGQKEVKKKYFSNSKIRDVKEGYIYISNGLSWHGGLCDRFKGIISIYKWCKINNKDFYIVFNSPFNLIEYLEPNSYNWKIEDNEVSYNRKDSLIIYLMYDKSVDKYVKDGSINKRSIKYINENIKKGRSFKQFHFYTNSQLYNNEEFGELFNELFKPSQEIQTILDFHLTQINIKYISISFRFMQLLGDFKDAWGEVLQKEDKETLINKSLNVIRDIHNNYPEYKILVTSDSSTFLNSTKQFHYTYIVEGILILKIQKK